MESRILKAIVTAGLLIGLATLAVPGVAAAGPTTWYLNGPLTPHPHPAYVAAGGTNPPDYHPMTLTKPGIPDVVVLSDPIGVPPGPDEQEASVFAATTPVTFPAAGWEFWCHPGTTTGTALGFLVELLIVSPGGTAVVAPGTGPTVVLPVDCLPPSGLPASLCPTVGVPIATTGSPTSFVIPAGHRVGVLLTDVSEALASPSGPGIPTEIVVGPELVGSPAELPPDECFTRVVSPSVDFMWPLFELPSLALLASGLIVGGLVVRKVNGSRKPKA